ncbi:hypothetical protein HanRHA438_Chr13g0579701 [Helianthus annuus]|nr:hypothetical protein HanIR_Chr13g0619011 [Helianthus annuus]KAJ0856552.1 hypothetical protein HanRHA438_Chr13g0579701 [Helianthus annuus]
MHKGSRFHLIIFIYTKYYKVIVRKNLECHKDCMFGQPKLFHNHSCIKDKV